MVAGTSLLASDRGRLSLHGTSMLTSWQGLSAEAISQIQCCAVGWPDPTRSADLLISAFRYIFEPDPTKRPQTIQDLLSHPGFAEDVHSPPLQPLLTRTNSLQLARPGNDSRNRRGGFALSTSPSTNIESAQKIEGTIGTDLCCSPHEESSATARLRVAASSALSRVPKVGWRVTVDNIKGFGTVRFVGAYQGTGKYAGKRVVGVEMDIDVGRGDGSLKGHQSVLFFILVNLF